MLLLFPVLSSADSATVSNSVSVSASGGQSTASVHTVINGETVTDVTLSDDESVEYHQTVTVDDNQTSLETTDKTEQTRLTALIKQLQALIKIYEKLLDQTK